MREQSARRTFARGAATIAMSRFPKKLTLAPLAACVALGAGAAAAQAPPTEPLAFEGPGGRVALAHWLLRKDPADRGLRAGWAKGSFGGEVVSVPDAIDTGSYKGRAGEANLQGSVAWYRTTVQAPVEGPYAFTFHSANHLATVWVDGRRLGSHRGSYLPFEERSTLSAGQHRLVVRIDWRDPDRQKLEGFHRTWFNWGGLDGPVDMRAVGASELSDPTLRTTLSPLSPTAGQATVRVTVKVTDHGDERTIRPEGSLSREGQTIPVSFQPLTLEPGRSATATGTAFVASPALWSPGSPSLYTLALSVPGESSYTARVGLRQLTWHDGRLYLNGTQIRLHGATVQEDVQGHGDALTGADEDRIVARLQRIGANAVRAQHPLEGGLLERLDAAGIVVWQGIGPVEGAGNWYSSTPRLLAEAEDRARVAVAEEALHPSVVAWNLVDEVAHNGHNGYEVRYVRDLSSWLHATDPTRMVAVDVWGDHPPARAGALYAQADAVAETDYTGWYDSPRASASQQAAQMRARLGAMERTFAGKVLVISEFGAESNGLNPPGAPGSYSYQSRLLAAHIAVYRSDPRLSGMLIWVLDDYPLTPTFQGGSIHNVLPHVRLIEGLNQKGLFTYGGAAKPAVAVVARMFKALGADG